MIHELFASASKTNTRSEALYLGQLNTGWLVALIVFEEQIYMLERDLPDARILPVIYMYRVSLTDESQSLDERLESNVHIGPCLNMAMLQRWKALMSPVRRTVACLLAGQCNFIFRHYSEASAIYPSEAPQQVWRSGPAHGIHARS